MPWVDVARERSELMGRQVQYGQEIGDWLRQMFPEFCSPQPHPGAVAAVIRLHYLHGRGRLTRGEHGDAIREFVSCWEARLQVESERQEAV